MRGESLHDVLCPRPHLSAGLLDSIFAIDFDIAFDIDFDISGFELPSAKSLFDISGFDISGFEL